MVRVPGGAASRRTWSPSPRGSAAACRSAPASRSAARPACWGRASHGSTFGGNPIAAAAALAVLDTIERDGLLGTGKERRAVTCGVAVGQVGHPLVVRRAGRGLLLGVVLTAPVAPHVAAAALERASSSTRWRPT